MAINEKVFLKFKILAGKLNNYEYDEITELIYNLHLGSNIGYEDNDLFNLDADAAEAKRQVRKEQKQKLKLIHCKE